MATNDPSDQLICGDKRVRYMFVRCFDSPPSFLPEFRVGYEKGNLASQTSKTAFYVRRLTNWFVFSFYANCWTRV